MPLFLINARDKADALPTRMANRADHLAWAASYTDQIWMAGPVFAEDGKTFAGSTFVIEFDSLQAAQAWAAEDPYAKAGVFGSVEIRLFNWSLGDKKT